MTVNKCQHCEFENPEETTLSIAKQICEVLKEAHHLGVIHRDLKPQNIMIDKDGNALIMDFGIARSVESDGFTDDGAMIGTPSYISPEQVDGKKADQRSDIYSLGIIIYEMATGTTPFKGETPVSIALKHKTEPTPNPIELNAQIPEGLKDIIFRCMEKEKEQRYQNTEEVPVDFKNIEQGLPSAERTYPKAKTFLSQQVTVHFSLNKRFIPIFAVLGVAIIIGIFLLIKSRNGPPSSRIDKISLAVMYFENNTGDDELDHWKKAISDLFIADLSQSKYINVLSAMQMQRILGEIEQLDTNSDISSILDAVASRGKVDHLLLETKPKRMKNSGLSRHSKKLKPGSLSVRRVLREEERKAYFGWWMISRGKSNLILISPRMKSKMISIKM